ncbi:MAG: methylmalonyl-CoA/ethylmalonyl-CoA epimerase [Bacillota bacterium]|jgi:methylmalonyl-CoA epimerase|nr:methylmalonyl-CoA/ethylmalonyl-CoA epimerase [Bacillota bacterium]MDK2925404.1 methylmalonyl-CoA/ethylmalonyl-CoA epimerase [Bacillota bacterium]MDK2959968.1 methylmalonyl-CoA/ethylmalonyl-CoA epimerase [Bacillota bacterium]
MIKKVDHIGIAVADLQKALKLYEETLGIKCAGVEEVAEQKVRTAFLPVGDTEIELLESTDPTSTVARFIEKRGEGIHHIALRVDDIKTALEKMKAAGIRLLDEVPRPGAGGARIAFLHPKDTGGVLIELIERG